MVFFLHSSTNAEITSLPEARIQDIRARLAVYRTAAQAAIDENAERLGGERARELWQVTLDRGVVYYEFELGWLEQTRARVLALPPLTSPAEIA